MNFRTVYKCYNDEGKECCIKKIPLNNSNTFADMMEREIYLLMNLKHPRIINMHSHFSVVGDDHIYIVMEYAHNGSLENFIIERRHRIQFLSENVFIMCRKCDKFIDNLFKLKIFFRRF